MKKREYDSRPRTEFDPSPPTPSPPPTSESAEAWQFCWKHRSWYGLTCGYCEGKLMGDEPSSEARTQLSRVSRGEARTEAVD